MIEQLNTNDPRILGFKLSGKLHDKDYQTFVPVVDASIADAGKVRLLVQFDDFQGWDLHAAWDDFLFGVTHYSDAERIAMVGDRKWEKWMARLCKPFTKAIVRYFEASQMEQAWTWVREGF